MTPETIDAGKAAGQAEIEALLHSNLPKEDLEGRQKALEQHLKVLTGLIVGVTTPTGSR